MIQQTRKIGQVDRQKGSLGHIFLFQDGLLQCREDRTVAAAVLTQNLIVGQVHESDLVLDQFVRVEAKRHDEIALCISHRPFERDAAVLEMFSNTSVKIPSFRSADGGTHQSQP